MSDIASLLASTVIFLFAQGKNISGQIPIGTAFIIGYPVPGQVEKVGGDWGSNLYS